MALRPVLAWIEGRQRARAALGRQRSAGRLARRRRRTGRLEGATCASRWTATVRRCSPGPSAITPVSLRARGALRWQQLVQPGVSPWCWPVPVCASVSRWMSGVAWPLALQGEVRRATVAPEPGHGWSAIGAPLRCVLGAVTASACGTWHSIPGTAPPRTASLAAPMVAWVERGDGRACVAPLERGRTGCWWVRPRAARPSGRLIGLQAHHSCSRRSW